MIEAVRTTASTEATWAIVIVAVCCLAFWLTMIMVADRQQVKASGPSSMPEQLAGPGIPGQPGVQTPAEPAATDAPTRPDLPAYQDMPAQRSGETDRAERSGTGNPARPPGLGG